ncbi:hypothetical protein K4K59_011502 [Colletotrichum sp. SAR11_240]|nr:hypothetical protein K4K59_011502 [Colletotrichum sp. SAR11_240]
MPDNSPTFLPHAIKRFVSPAHKNNLESAELKVKKTRQDFDTIVKKRNFSELSAASITSEHDDRRIRGEASEEVFEAFLKAKEAELQAAKEKRAILEKMWEDGDISDRNEFHNALDMCQQQINHDLMRVATLRCSRHQLIGQLTDEALFPEQVERERKLDWAYIDGLLWKYHAPYGATATIESEVTEDQRARFRKAVITAQGSTAADGQVGFLTEEEARKFWDLKHDPDPLSTFAEDLSTTMAFRCEAGLIPDDEEGGAEDHLVQKAKGKGKQK